MYSALLHSGPSAGARPSLQIDSRQIPAQCSAPGPGPGAGRKRGPHLKEGSALNATKASVPPRSHTASTKRRSVRLGQGGSVG